MDNYLKYKSTKLMINHTVKKLNLEIQKTEKQNENLMKFIIDA